MRMVCDSCYDAIVKSFFKQNNHLTCFVNVCTLYISNINRHPSLLPPPRPMDNMYSKIWKLWIPNLTNISGIYNQTGISYNSCCWGIIIQYSNTRIFSRWGPGNKVRHHCSSHVQKRTQRNICKYLFYDVSKIYRSDYQWENQCWNARLIRSHW